MAPSIKTIATTGTLFVALSGLCQSAVNEGRTRFLVNEGVVFDTSTGLRWQRCSLGLTWNVLSKECAGIPSKLTYAAAISLNNQKSRDDCWHIPTVDELSTIIEMQRAGNKIDETAFPDISEKNKIFWTMIQPQSKFTWLVDFERGVLFDTLENKEMLNQKISVRLVSSKRSKIISGG